VQQYWVTRTVIYRFYHQSLKVFWAPGSPTKEIVDLMQSLAPHLPLNAWFMEIVAQGTGKEVRHGNETSVGRRLRAPSLRRSSTPRFFLEMVCKYGKELQEPPQFMPSGWAAVLCLYNLR